MDKLKRVIVLLFTLTSLFLFTSGVTGAFQNNKKPNSPASATKPSTEGQASPSTSGTGTGAAGKYAEKFDHYAKAEEGKVRKAHAELSNAQSCEVCHERTDNNPKTVLPYHDSCVKCHAKEFTDPKLEICAGCHNKPYNDKPVVYDMNKLNQFGMEFSHTTHKTRANFNCETCHNTPADNKTARSTYPNHPECFTCHQANNVPAKGLCIECHNTKAQAQKFRTRDQIEIAYKYFQFNHGIHLVRVKPEDRRCERCHDVLNSDASTQTDISRIKVTLSADPNKIHKSVCFNKCHDPNPQGTGQQCYLCHLESEKPLGSLALRLPKNYVIP